MARPINADLPQAAPTDEPACSSSIAMVTVFPLVAARAYLPAPKANFARVVINGESWGIYVSAQQFDRFFLEGNFATDKKSSQVNMLRTRGKRVISGHTAAQLRTMLEGAFAPGGTASEVSIPGYKLAGKTGTANKIDPTTHEYSDSQYVASFIGFAPALHPKLLIEVMVDEPQTEIYGGVVAAPAFEKIASFALPYLRIPPG